MKELAHIREVLLRELIQATDSVDATVAGVKQGFGLVFRFGVSDKAALVTSRGTIRIFASLDTAAAFVRDLGIFSFEVDMTNYQPGRLRKPRPDRAEALRRTRTSIEAAAVGVQR